MGKNLFYKLSELLKLPSVLTCYFLFEIFFHKQSFVIFFVFLQLDLFYIA